LIGLTTISEFDPDVILLDLMMPTMNWFETLYSIKNQTSSKSKIIVFTNIIDKEKIEEAKAYWVDDYLVKANVDPSDVIATINKVLWQKYDEQEKVEPIRINPGLNIFKLKNPVSEEDIEISVNVKI
jgi:DNA-binding response OmpR family regulator